MRLLNPFRSQKLFVDLYRSTEFFMPRLIHIDHLRIFSYIALYNNTL